MQRSGEIQVVKGRANIQCPSCRKTRQHQIPPGVRHKNLRCLRNNCDSKGKSTWYTFNHRKNRRESAPVKVVLSLSEGTETVFIKNVSMDGISFQGRKIFQRLRVGDRLEIQLRDSSGKKVIRRITITNKSLDNIGAEYTDMPKF